MEDKVQLKEAVKEKKSSDIVPQESIKQEQVLVQEPVKKEEPLKVAETVEIVKEVVPEAKSAPLPALPEKKVPK